MEWVFFNGHDSLITKAFNLYEKQKCIEAKTKKKNKIASAHIYAPSAL